MQIVLRNVSLTKQRIFETFLQLQLLDPVSAAAPHELPEPPLLAVHQTELNRPHPQACCTPLSLPHLGIKIFNFSVSL